jgi:large subunit ribosomal protein L10
MFAPPDGRLRSGSVALIATIGAPFLFREHPSPRKHTMPTVKKEKKIEELRNRLADAKYLFFTNYAGLTVEEITKLRTALRKDGSTYAVVKNTLFSRAAGDELAHKLEAFLAGPTGVVFAPADPVSPAKALKQFSDNVKPIDVKAAYVDGAVLDARQISVLASMPAKAELQARLLGLLASPMRGLVGVLAANPSGFVRVLSAREKQLAESAS